jgi:hypothetical protein
MPAMRRLGRSALDARMMIGARRTKPKRRVRSNVDQARDLRILQSLAWAGFLSTGQIERLHFPSRRTAQRRLRALLDHGLVRACLQGMSLHLQNVYALTATGSEFLAARGVQGTKPRRVVRFQKLEHALAVRDLFVAVSMAANVNAIELEDFRFEDDLAKEPVFQSAGIIPDGLAFVRRGDDRRVIGCEIDLGSETGRMLKAKCALWVQLLRSAVFDKMDLLFVVVGAGRASTISDIMADAGAQCSCVLRCLLIEHPLELVDGLFAQTIRAARIGAPEITEGFQLVEKIAPGGFRIADGL